MRRGAAPFQRLAATRLVLECLAGAEDLAVVRLAVAGLAVVGLAAARL